MRAKILVLLAVLAVFHISAAASCQARDAADLILYNGVIHTMNPRLPEASAIAVTNGAIASVGSNESVLKLKDQKTRLLDLKGKIIVPGFIECHAHLVSLGMSMLHVNLRGRHSEADVVAAVKEAAARANPGEWIVGYGWDQADWGRKEMPDCRLLSAATPEFPVFLKRVDAHTIWVNEKALALSGITRDTKDPEGGIIERDDKGNPTGVLIDTARELVIGHMPRLTTQQIREAIMVGMREAAAQGVTTFTDASTSQETFDILKEMAEKHQLPLRLYLMLNDHETEMLANDRGSHDKILATAPLIDFGNGFLTARTIKVFADGTLGSRAAALIEPYSDKPGFLGVLDVDEEQMFKITQRALASGYQVATHAIGDRANHAVVAAYERALKVCPNANARLRVEHAQIIDADDIGTMKRCGIVASMQPVHCSEDSSWVEDRLGKERAAREAYVWRDMLNAGVTMIGGSDAPFGKFGPIFGIYSAVTRRSSSGITTDAWHPEQRLSAYEALRMFTTDGAYGSFQENKIGTIEPGKYADLTVLSKDILKVPADEISAVAVEQTIVAGKTIYDRSQPAGVCSAASR